MSTKYVPGLEGIKSAKYSKLLIHELSSLARKTYARIFYSL